MKNLISALLCLMLTSCQLSSIDPYKASAPTQNDYTFMWWSQGWPGQVKGAPSVVCLQTGYYGLSLDTQKAALLTLGGIDRPGGPDTVVAEDNQAVMSLPSSKLNLEVLLGSTVYRCTGSRGAQEDVFEGETVANFRIINSGRLMQRADIVGLEFKDADGRVLDAVGRLEIVAWPDTVSFLLEITPESDLSNAAIHLSLHQDGEQIGTAKNAVKESTMKKGHSYVQSLAWDAKPAARTADSSLTLKVRDRELDKSLEIEYDALRNWHRIQLPEKTVKPHRIERLQMTCINTDDQDQTFRLFLDSEYLGGMTGLIPVVRDLDGNPAGIYVQVSKNWHKVKPDGTLIEPILYQGDWFHGFILLHIPAKTTLEFETTIVCGNWGGLPAASHAQLCLVGWGINQLWDQVAIGNWGESICYDPDINLTRSMIDDLRPLMVWAMTPSPKTKWTWTNNVGGGDFLVYYDKDNQRQPLTRMKTFYDYLGPNLTQVTYAGITRDGHIRGEMTVMTPRCDDINRTFHKVRYDVDKKTPFNRLAFYQVGADRYNDHQFNKMARGNLGGMIEEWEVEKGGLKYHRTALPCQGDSPWFSLHDAVNRFNHGPTANRMLVIREWNARLGGKPAPHPYASVYGTENRFPSANVELSAWPDVSELLPGDFVEFTVELAVIPQFAEDYYGPNKFLKKLLADGENTYQPAYALARKNHLEVEMIAGKLLGTWPLTIEVDAGQKAEFRVKGGVSYFPVEFRGLTGRTGYQLAKIVDGKLHAVDQTDLGNDFWQTEYCPKTQTYNMIFNVEFNEAATIENWTKWRFSKP